MSILDKIRKLRALAQSDNVNEAASAAAAAERLIQEHDIAEAELHVTEEEPCFFDAADPVASFAKKVPTWQTILLASLSRQYHTAGIWIGPVYKVAGRPSDVATLRYQFAYFTAEVTRLALKHGKGKGRTWSNSFRNGAVSAIRDSLQTAKAEARAHATSTALAIVDSRATMAKQALTTAFPSVRKRSVNAGSLNGDGFEAGKQAAAGINQRSQLTASGVRMLGA